MSSLNEKIIPFQRKINNIITDLLSEGTYEDMMGLQNSELCGEITLLLEEELSTLNKLELNDLSVSIIGKQTKCSDKDCKEIKEKKIGKQGKSKEELCLDISIFYVRILNIISAIVTAVDSENNLCIRRLKALFNRIDDKNGKVSVCQDDKKLYPSSFLKVEGMPYLLKLYHMYDVPGSSKTNEEKRREIEMLQLNIKKFFKEPAQDFSGDDINDMTTNNQVMSSSIKNKLEKIESNVKKVKTGLANFGDVFQKKGYLNNKNVKKIQLNRNNMGNLSESGNNNEGASNEGESNEGASNEGASNEGASNEGGNNQQRDNNLENAANTKINNSNNTTNNQNQNNTNKSGNSNETEGRTNNLNNLNNEEANGSNTNGEKSKNLNLSEISGNQNENVLDSNKQKGGKNRKTKKRNKIRRNSKKSRKQKGGMNILRNLFSTSKAPVTEEKVEDLNNNLTNERAKNKKNTSDLIKLVTKNKVSQDKIMNGSDIKVGYVPTNLSKKPECKTGKLNTTINITEAKFSDFNKKYVEFENHYYNSSVDLLNFLESNVLRQDGKGKYSIKKFDLLQLDAIEKNTREKLIQYYSKCQELFTQSFFELVKALGVSTSGSNAEEEREGEDMGEVNEQSIEVNNLD